MRDTGCSEADAVPDLLADLMHYCRERGEEFDAYVAIAQTNFDVEQWGLPNLM